jgi:hypothetical protein
VPGVMLAFAGMFQIMAAFGAFIPSFVHDRVPEQFIPVWRFLTRPFYGDVPSESVILALATISQYIIGITEGAIGLTLLIAAGSSRRRLALANFGLGLSIGLYGTFMLTMFAMHDPSLPKWNQYPAILAWLGVTWLVVSLTDKGAPAFIQR